MYKPRHIFGSIGAGVLTAVLVSYMTASDRPAAVRTEYIFTTAAVQGCDNMDVMFRKGDGIVEVKMSRLDCILPRGY